MNSLDSGMNKGEADSGLSPVSSARGGSRREVLAVLACTLLTLGCSKDKDVVRVKEALNDLNRRTVRALDQCLKWEEGDLDSLIEANKALNNFTPLATELQLLISEIGTLSNLTTRGSIFLSQLATVHEFNHSVVVPNMGKLADCLKNFCITEDGESLCDDNALVRKADASIGETAKKITATIEIIESQLRIISACGIIDNKQLAEELCQYVDVEHACLPDLDKACPEVAANKERTLDTFMVLRDKISQLNKTLGEMNKLGYSGPEFENLRKRAFDAMVLVERAIKALKIMDPPAKENFKDKKGTGDQYPNGLTSNSGVESLGLPAFPPNRTREEIRRFS